MGRLSVAGFKRKKFSAKKTQSKLCFLHLKENGWEIDLRALPTRQMQDGDGVHGVKKRRG